jgi:hypothetical protein
VEFWKFVLGGFVGALGALAVNGLVWFYLRPKLKMSFTAMTRGCIIDTPSQGGRQRALRIFIENHGWKTAHQVSVSATHIEFYPSEQGNPAVLADDVLQLQLALTADRTIFDLPSGAYRWIDVVFADDMGQGATLRFGFSVQPLRLPEQGFGGRGSYSMEVTATSEDASAGTTKISWHWDGTLKGLYIPSGR